MAKQYKYTLLCETCGKEFKNSFSHTRVCSLECKKRKAYRISKLNIPTNAVGALSELKITCDLIEKGYSVFRPLCNSIPCDILSYKDGVLKKIEVRTGYRAPNNRLLFPKRTAGKIDYFAIYIYQTNEIIYFEIDGKTEIKL